MTLCWCSSTAPLCSCWLAMLTQHWCQVQLNSHVTDGRQCQHSIGALYSSTVLLTAGDVNTELMPSTAPQCSCWWAMSTQCWCPVQLHCAHASGQCQHSVGAQYSSTVMLLTVGDVNTVLVLQYSSTVLLTAGDVDTALVPHTAPQCL